LTFKYLKNTFLFSNLSVHNDVKNQDVKSRSISEIDDDSLKDLFIDDDMDNNITFKVNNNEEINNNKEEYIERIERKLNEKQKLKEEKQNRLGLLDRGSKSKVPKIKSLSPPKQIIKKQNKEVNLEKIQLLSGKAKIDRNHVAYDALITPFLRAKQLVKKRRELKRMTQLHKIALVKRAEVNEINNDDIYNMKNQEYVKLRELIMCDVDIEVKMLHMQFRNSENIDEIINLSPSVNIINPPEFKEFDDDLQSNELSKEHFNQICNDTAKLIFENYAHSLHDI